MSFLDPAFLFCFLPLALALFYIAGRQAGPSAAGTVLILATLVFCLPFGWRFLTLLTVSTVINLVAFQLLASPIAGAQKRRFWILVATLCFNFALLAAVKYSAPLAALPGFKPILAEIAAFAPVTISFLTFQRAVMLLDVYQRRPEDLALAAAPGGRLRVGVFMLTFPNLLIGPIAYLSELFPQLARRGFGRLRQIDIKVGATLLVVGLAKKILIADPLGSNAVDPLFGAAAAGNHIVPLEAGLAMVAYTAQLYFDFSGYSDMALGIARMFGLRLPINFNSPLRATGIIDFWRRWHITLTRVIAKVLFTPLALAGTRFAGRHQLKGWSAKLVAVWLPILLNFEVIALWHGAQATFFAFGIFHGLWFIFETEVRATRRWKAFAKKTSPNLRRYLGQAITFAPLVISFALFRSHSMADFGHLLAGFGNDWLGVLHSSEGRALSTILPLAYLILAFAIIWLAPNANEMMRKYRPGIVTFSVPSTTPRFARLTWRPTLFWALLVMALALKIAFSLNAPTPFVYGGF